MGIKTNSSGANIGDIKPHASAVIPAGWLVCGGQAVSRVTYSALFLAIGVLYGVGDGVNTFNLPDLRGRALLGRDDMGGTPANRVTTGNSGLNGVQLGAVGGAEVVTLTAGQMPNHGHPYTANNTNSVGNSGTSQGGSDIGSSTGAAGSSGSHSNMPPAMVINYIIKT